MISPHLPLLEIFKCPLFPPGLDNPQSFRWWSNSGLTTVRSLLSPRGIVSFQSLRDSHDIPETEKFRYLQIRHLLETLTKNHDWSTTATAFETRCRTSPTTKGLISLLYSSMLNNTNTQSPSYCHKWERDFNTTLEPEIWRKIWGALFRSSRNILALENSYKVLSRWYLTPDRIAKCLPSYPSTCFRGCPDPGDMKHIWWLCPKVKRLWIRVYNLINSVLHLNLRRDPWEALLHKPIEDASKCERILVSHIFSATKQTIARAWKTPLLSFEEVKNRVHGTLVNEKLTAILSDTHDKFLRVWRPWTEFFPPTHSPTRFLDL